MYQHTLPCCAITSLQHHFEAAVLIWHRHSSYGTIRQNSSYGTIRQNSSYGTVIHLMAPSGKNTHKGVCFCIMPYNTHEGVCFYTMPYNTHEGVCFCTMPYNTIAPQQQKMSSHHMTQSVLQLHHAHALQVLTQLLVSQQARMLNMNI